MAPTFNSRHKRRLGASGSDQTLRYHQTHHYFVLLQTTQWLEPHGPSVSKSQLVVYLYR